MVDDTPSLASTGPTESGVALGSGASITVGAGDVEGGDKIVNNIQNLYQCTLTVAAAVQETERQARAVRS